MSLTYFTDAEGEPMPYMLAPFEWQECKEFFVREVRALGYLARKSRQECLGLPSSDASEVRWSMIVR